MKLLEKLCRGVKPASYTQNYPDVILMCVNMVALMTHFVHRNTPKVCGRRLRKEDGNVSVSFTAFRDSITCYHQGPEGEPKQQYANDLVSQARSTLRDWICSSFKQNLLKKAWFSSITSPDMEVSSYLYKNINSIVLFLMQWFF